MALDRVAPTRRPSSKVRGYQEWSELLFLHWEVSESELRKRVPDSLELDAYEGRYYVGLVPFAMQAVRPAWCPRQLGFHFLETNVRTYVHRNGEPGVYFFSLDAASSIAVWIARTLWHLPYFKARMSMRKSNATSYAYTVERKKTPSKTSLEYSIGPALPASQPGEIDFFLLERYLLFAEHAGVTYRGQVHHRPYPAHTATLERCDDGLVSAAGFSVTDRNPAYVHFSPGVAVEIFDIKKC